MPKTPAPLALPYPSLSDPPDGAGGLAALATRIDAIIGHDSGWVDVTPMSDWNGANNLVMRRCGQVCSILATPLIDSASKTAQDVPVVIVSAEFQASYSMSFPVLINNNATAYGEYNILTHQITIKSLTVVGSHSCRFVLTYPTAFLSS